MVDFDDDFIPMSDDELNDVTLPDVYGSVADTPDVGDTPDTPDVGDAPEPVGPTYAETEEQPEEEAVTSIFDLIPIAISQRRHLQITYTSIHKGTTKDYVIEPYEVGGHGSVAGGFLWGWDIEVGTIKSFYLSQISSIELLDTTFIPRFS